MVDTDWSLEVPAMFEALRIAVPVWLQKPETRHFHKSAAMHSVEL